MNATMILSPVEWARREFGRAELGDKRRTARAVAMASRIMRNPSASLPTQMSSPKALKGSYRLLAREDVTYESLMNSHWEQTLSAARAQPLVLMIQDTTEVDYTHHPTTAGLGPIGDGNGRGYLLHSVLAVIPKPRQLLGLAHQEPFLRQPAPAEETCAQRQKRPRESQVWSRAVKAVGKPPAGVMWVHVGDRYSDIFEFMETCLQNHTHFLVRAAQDRRVESDNDERLNHLFAFARSLPAQGEKTIDIPARDKRPARKARLALSFGPIRVKPPVHSPHKAPLDIWVVRCWELDPPPEVKEPLEWILLTLVPTLTLADAEERLEWYTCRWMSEDYHQCLKTGCAIEKRQLREGQRLFRLLGFLALTAVRLLQLREIARLTPDRLARAELPRELVNLVALLAEVPSESLTVGDFWRHVAGFGGYLGRRRDGPPGWKTLWRGWLYIQTLLEGVQLAAQLPP